MQVKFSGIQLDAKELGKQQQSIDALVGLQGIRLQGARMPPESASTEVYKLLFGFSTFQVSLSPFHVEAYLNHQLASLPSPPSRKAVFSYPQTVPCDLQICCCKLQMQYPQHHCHKQIST